MLDRFEFVFGEGVQGMRRHGLMSFAAISTVAVALYLIGGLGYLYFELQTYASQLSSRYEIQAFLKDGATPQIISETARKVRSIEGVASVVHIPKERAWERTKRENPELTVGIDNPYPDAIKVTVGDLSKTTEIVDALKSIGSIQADAVMYHDPTQRFLNDMMRLIRWIGAALGGLLMATAGVLIYNAIRLAIDSRRREIRIMQLVGASHATIRVPFLIEGAVQGAIGGVVAAVALWGTYEALARYIKMNLTAFGSPEPFLFLPALLLTTCGGLAYGIVCSMLAIRRPSKVRSEPL